MWPFKSKPMKSKADLAIEWMPRAIDVAAKKWFDFNSQTFVRTMSLEEKLVLFTRGLASGLGQWNAFRDSPDSLMLLIAAKGVEKSRTHLRIEIESALGIALPTPHERSDQEESRILMDKIVDRACRKWKTFEQALKFGSDVAIQDRILMFETPFIQGVKADFQMLKDAPDDFFRQLIVLGIKESGTLSPDEVSDAFDMIS